MDRVLWEVQTLAANLSPMQLRSIRGRMVDMLGGDESDQIIHDCEDDWAELNDE